MKLEIEQTPSQQIIAKAAATVTVTDSAGREIVLKKPGVLAQFGLIEALGDLAKNEVYTSMCLPLIYVSSVAGDEVLPLTTHGKIKALIQQLDEHGIAAVVEGVSLHFGQQDPEKDKAAAKK
jgi:hypothetical protein